MQNINADDIESAIKTSLKDWESEKWKQIEELADRKGEELKERVIRDAPVQEVKGGTYKRGFKVRKEKSDRVVKISVYNSSKRKSIMHLLEDGHASRNGGRVSGIPHLRKNEKEVNEEFYEEAKKIYES